MFLNLVLHKYSFLGGKSQKQEDIPPSYALGRWNVDSMKRGIW